MSDTFLAADTHAPVTPCAVAVVILNWRAPAMTLAAVERVLAQSTAPERIFVVENGSGDDSVTRLTTDLAPYADTVTLLVNPENLGFGGGCNTALRAALANYDYCWLLNNDAEPEPECLQNLLMRAKRTPQVGAVGSNLRDPSVAGIAHYGSWLDPVTLISYGIYDPDEIERHRYSWLTAASLLLSVSALRDVGLFDERFFMYWEDADLNMRLRNAGYALVAAPDAVVTHTAGTSSNSMVMQRYIWHFRSHRVWLGKHHDWGRVMTAWLRVKYLVKAGLDRDAARFKALLRA